MKVAYLFESEHAREILEYMIIPQLEEDRHGVEVAGMMFFFDNAYMLVEGSDIAARLQKLSEKTGITTTNLSILKTNKAKAIRFSTLEAICKALNCQPGDILEYKEEEND